METRPWVLKVLVCVWPVLAAGQAVDETRPVVDEQVLFADLPKVEAAALHAQTLAEAPANVSVITAEEIRRQGYRTLAEALSSVRGFTVTYDHEYHYLGVRGLSLPGDFNTRILVMLNGHPLTDNIYNSNGFFGQDFGLDMELVERIEVIRGPTSALYGSNGMLANINVVTRSPVDADRLRVAVETGSAGERKISASSAMYLGRGANLLIAASVFNNEGVSFPVTDLGLPAGVPASVGNVDGERGYHTFANLIWRHWSFVAYFNARNKQTPVGVGSSLAGDPAQRAIDTRNLIGATYKRQAGPGTLQWQTYYDQYRYRDHFDYPQSRSLQPVEDFNRGDWFDSELTYEVAVPHVGILTAGIQGSGEVRAEQYNVVGGQRENYVNRPDRGVAVFAQQQWDLSPRWKLYGGVRFDESWNFGRFASPRLAGVYQPSARTVYKLVYGRPFRNPSAFEQFYSDGGRSYVAAPRLRPETAHAFEASVEHQVARAWTVVVNASHYRIGGVIEAATLADGAQQYGNRGLDRSTGLEFELSGRLWERLDLSASTALNHAVGEDLATLANSPRQVSKLRAALPLGTRGLASRLILSGAMQFVSARNSWTGDRLGGAALVDFTATGRLPANFELQAGVRNAFDRRYEDPVYLSVDRLRGDGRSAYLRLVWRVRE